MPSSYTSSLAIDSSKLKPNFENYKLKLNHNVIINAFALPHSLSIDKIDSHLGYKEFAKRVAVNDLFISDYNDMQTLFFGRRDGDLSAFVADLDEVG